MPLNKNQSLFMWIVLAGLILNGMIFIFTGFFPGTSFSQSIPGLSQVNQYEGNLTQAGKNIAIALNFNTYPKTTCNPLDIICAATGFIEGLGNGILYSVISIIVNIFILFGLGLAIAFLILTGTLPGILSSLNLGVIADIIYLIEGVLGTVIVYYILVIIIEWINTIRGR